VKISVVRSIEISAAHTQKQIGPPCDRVHGHNYKVTVWFKGQVDPDLGIVKNFSEIKLDLQRFIGLYDHTLLNDYYDMTSAEYLAQMWLGTLHTWNKGYWKLRLEETDRSSVEVEWED
jgi:6-pyruvoyltetrahydropterin/6-carboxytetrahydropterin synthase